MDPDLRSPLLGASAVSAPDAAILLRWLCTSEGSVGLWTLDLWITLPLVLSGTLYASGIIRLWRHARAGRGIGFAQVGCYAAGWLVLAGALVSPIHRWAWLNLKLHSEGLKRRTIWLRLKRCLSSRGDPFAITVPSEAVTGQLAWQSVVIMFGFTAVLLAVSRWCWKRGLRRYGGASA